MEQDFKVKSLAKAMRILECFSTSRPELGITEIAQMLSLHKSTVHNIANTLEQMEYLEQNQETGKYYLGIKLLQFSYIINNHMGLQRFFLPCMKNIARMVNMTVYLGIPYGNNVLYIECTFPDENNRWRHILGEHAPMHCTGIGKAMLAYLPIAQQEAYLSGPLERFTDATLCTLEALRKDLVETRERGYAIDRMEHEYGITCIGMPIFGHDRRLVAAISVSASAMLLTDESFAPIINCMKEALEPVQYKL